jgi:hypothetical protein
MSGWRSWMTGSTPASVNPRLAEMWASPDNEPVEALRRHETRRCGALLVALQRGRAAGEKWDDPDSF